MIREVNKKLDIYKITKSEELLKYYQDWTKKNKYNQDMIDWNYTAPKEAVSVLKKHALNKKCKILDAGCGTGLVGIELKKNGYSNIELVHPHESEYVIMTNRTILDKKTGKISNCFHVFKGDTIFEVTRNKLLLSTFTNSSYIESIYII